MPPGARGINTSTLHSVLGRWLFFLTCCFVLLVLSLCFLFSLILLPVCFLFPVLLSSKLMFFSLDFVNKLILVYGVLCLGPTLLITSFTVFHDLQLSSGGGCPESLFLFSTFLQKRKNT